MKGCRSLFPRRKGKGIQGASGQRTDYTKHTLHEILSYLLSGYEPWPTPLRLYSLYREMSATVEPRHPRIRQAGSFPADQTASIITPASPRDFLSALLLLVLQAALVIRLLSSLLSAFGPSAGPSETGLGL